jgi:glutathione S-transferase
MENERRPPMIVVHHLNNSRSQRILWLLEELGLHYEVKFYRRDSKSNGAPPELKQVHPLGRSPVITDDGKVMAESAAIIDYIIRHHGGGRLQPAVTDPSYDDYVFWMHYAEGSAIQPVALKVNAARIGKAAAPIEARIERELANDLGYIDSHLAGRSYLLGHELSGADIQLSFVGELAGRWTDRSEYKNLEAWVRRFQARPAYLAAVERGGVYALAEDPE